MSNFKSKFIMIIYYMADLYQQGWQKAQENYEHYLQEKKPEKQVHPSKMRSKRQQHKIQVL